MIKYVFIILFLFLGRAFANLNFSKDFSLTKIEIQDISNQLNTLIFSKESWPSKLELDNTNYSLDYTIKEDLNNFVKKELRRYGSDYASVVVIDNNSGDLLTAIDYTKETRSFGKNLTFSATNPAASIFKVITAADLIENNDLDEGQTFHFNGKSTTLYKYQLKNKLNKWTRKTTLQKAFAMSNNVVFGKAAINHSSYKSLTSMARKFGFDQDIMHLLSVGSSKLFMKKSDYGLAELASGFNKGTLISPVHGAMIASVIANDGIMKKAKVIKKVQDVDHDLLVWKPELEEHRVLSKESAQAMQKMMGMTVKRGTARGSFRRHRKRVLDELSIGGKTGTITGGLPYGKRDWFVSYAMPKDGSDKGISICIMIVNVKKWYIKSPVLAKNIIEYYYSKVQKVGKL